MGISFPFGYICCRQQHKKEHISALLMLVIIVICENMKKTTFHDKWKYKIRQFSGANKKALNFAKLKMSGSGAQVDF